MQTYDLIVIGAGPAGLTAAIYGARSKLRALYIEKLLTGGQAATTDKIENFPGFPQGVTGPELTANMEEQAKFFGAERLSANVSKLKVEGNWRIVKTNKGEFSAQTVIIASGAAPKLLGCRGEFEFRARGVSYCATCDAAFYEDTNVMVVGGGDSAVEEAIYLTKFAAKVTLVHRRNSLRATKIVQERAFANPKLEIVWNTVVEEIMGSNIVEKVVLKDTLTGEKREMPIDGVFIYVGLEPNTDWLQGLIETDANGYIKTDETMCTNVPGVYAVGDVRCTPLRQVVTAAADGAIAAFYAEKYVENSHETTKAKLRGETLANLIEVTKDTYEQEVLQSPLPVLIDLWGPKCFPCLGLMPVVEELAGRYAGKIKFCKVNTAQNRRLAIQLGVMSLPTFLFYKNGEVIAQLQGDFGLEEIESKIKGIVG